MDKSNGILVFGANGSVKTTLARELSRVLNFKHMDIEDYCFEESEIPYSKPGTREHYLELMLEDIEIYHNFVISTVIGHITM